MITGIAQEAEFFKQGLVSLFRHPEFQEVDSLFQRMGSKTVKHTIDLAVGESVIITDGPFKELEGRVGEVDEERGRVKVMVPMFGRETPVELDFLQIKKI